MVYNDVFTGLINALVQRNSVDQLRQIRETIDARLSHQNNSVPAETDAPRENNVASEES